MAPSPIILRRRTCAKNIPLDILRLVFETAAGECPSTACSLALVARLAQSWVEPILYKAIIVTEESMLETLAAKVAKMPPGFAEKVVEALFIGAGRSDGPSGVHLERLLKRCTGVRRLVTFVEFPSSWLSDMHLASVTLFVSKKARSRFNGGPQFTTVTHLELLNSPVDVVNTPIFSTKHFPSLTHLAFGKPNIGSPDGDALLTTFARDVFDTHCARLKTLLFVLEGWESVERTRDALRPVDTYDARRIFVGFKQQLDEYWRDYLEGEDIWEKTREVPLCSAMCKCRVGSHLF